MRYLSLSLVFTSLLSYSLAAFPANSNSLLGNLQTCETKAQSDIACITSVRDGLQKTSDYIKKVRDIKNTIKKIQTGISTFKALLGVVKYAPPIKLVAEGLKRTLQLSIEPGLKRGYDAAKRVDDKLYPWKGRIDNGVKACDRAITELGRVKTVCNRGKISVTAARNCITTMPNNNVKSSLGNALETTSGAINSIVAQAVTALGNVGGSCAAVKAFTDISVRWPSVDGILNSLNDMYNALKPILKVLQDIQNALRKKFCVNVVFKKFCFSVQGILDGVDRLVKPLTDLANQAINAVLRHVPSFNLPGLPSFAPLNINLNINLPNIDFSINLPTLLQLNFDCSLHAKGACQAGAVSNLVTAKCGSNAVITPQSNYLGCWKDASNRAISLYQELGSSNNVQRCRDRCASLRYKYSGNQYTTQCFCGDAYNRYGQVSDSECGAVCPGNRQEKCGGTWRNSVYKSGYLGCFEDRGTRDLTGSGVNLGASGNLANCLTKCRSEGFKYAGLQYYSWCFCGNTYNKYGEKPKSDCSTTCRGNASQKCGGPWRNSIFTTGV